MASTNKDVSRFVEYDIRQTPHTTKVFDLMTIFEILTAALPFILPFAFLLIRRLAGYQYSIQRTLSRVAVGFYLIGLLFLFEHALQMGGGFEEFLNAFYGHPVDTSILYYLGLVGESLAVVAIIFNFNKKIVNPYVDAALAGADIEEDNADKPNPNIRKPNRKRDRRKQAQMPKHE